MTLVLPTPAFSSFAAVSGASLLSEMALGKHLPNAHRRGIFEQRSGLPLSWRALDPTSALASPGPFVAVLDMAPELAEPCRTPGTWRTRRCAGRKASI